MMEQGEALAAEISTGFAQAECGELEDGEEAIRTLRKLRAERLMTRG
jgi:predicted transcriptional regulator